MSIVIGGNTITNVIVKNKNGSIVYPDKITVVDKSGTSHDILSASYSWTLITGVTSNYSFTLNDTFKYGVRFIAYGGRGGDGSWAPLRTGNGGSGGTGGTCSYVYINGSHVLTGHAGGGGGGEGSVPYYSVTSGYDTYWYDGTRNGPGSGGNGTNSTFENYSSTSSKTCDYYGKSVSITFGQGGGNGGAGESFGYYGSGYGAGNGGNGGASSNGVSGSGGIGVGRAEHYSGKGGNGGSAGSYSGGACVLIYAYTRTLS